ncbi:MAG: hypothetical protein ACF8R7_03165 [Phycisphaerales bacterium JB039]
MLRALCALAVVITLCGCTSTRLTTVWKAPDAPEKIEFSSVVVACLFPDETARRAAEDQLVARIGPQRATPSYQLLSLEDAQDPDVVRRRLADAGFDGALVMRVISVDKEQTWTPGAPGRPIYYDSFHSYYGYGWSTASSYGRWETDTIVQIETILYDFDDDARMIWGARSETFNPSSVSQTVEEIANAIRDRLRQDGLIE